jgi:uncharacterized membrane protein YhaH (DUF805 family)
MKWYVNALKNYAVLNGRASRKAYWMFVLVHFLIIVTAGLLARLIEVRGEGFDHVVLAYAFATMIPYLALSVRRMHDVGRTGLWLLFAPVHAIFLLMDSQPGDNEYGRNPKEALLDSSASVLAGRLS